MVTQADAPGCASAHRARAIVLPAPGGPVMTVSGVRAPCAMSLLIRGRWTAQPGTPGAVIFEARTGSSAPVRCQLDRAGPRADALVTTDTTLTLEATDIRPAGAA